MIKNSELEKKEPERLGRNPWTQGPEEPENEGNTGQLDQEIRGPRNERNIGQGNGGGGGIRKPGE